MKGALEFTDGSELKYSVIPYKSGKFRAVVSFKFPKYSWGRTVRLNDSYEDLVLWIESKRVRFLRTREKLGFTGNAY